MFDFQEELKKLPHQPGVYIMHDEKDAIIYVGKAVDLHRQGQSPETIAEQLKISKRTVYRYIAS